MMDWRKIRNTVRHTRSPIAFHLADQLIKLELLDHYNSDSDEGSDPGPPVKAGQNEADSIGVPNPRAGSMIGEEDRDRGEEDEDEEDEEAGSGFDSDLAAEINKGLEAMNAPQAASDSDSDGDGLFGGSSGSDDEDEEEAANPEELEQRRRIKLLAEEAGDLDRAIKAKESELLKAFNPIMKVRLYLLFSLRTFSHQFVFYSTETIRSHDSKTHG
jgi:transcription initiation factor TFIID subunit 7